MWFMNKRYLDAYHTMVTSMSLQSIEPQALPWRKHSSVYAEEENQLLPTNARYAHAEM
jgi:hypothetical protein